MSRTLTVETYRGVPIRRNSWERRFFYDFHPIYSTAGKVSGRRFGNTEWTGETVEELRADIDRCLADAGIETLVPREPRPCGEDSTLVHARRILPDMDFRVAVDLATRILADPITRSVTDGVAWNRWVVQTGPGTVLFAHRDATDDRTPREGYDISRMDCAVMFANDSRDEIIAEFEENMGRMFGPRYGAGGTGWRWAVIARFA